MGTLWIHPVTSSRLDPSPEDFSSTLREIFGSDDASKIRLVTTKWSMIPSKLVDETEKYFVQVSREWDSCTDDQRAVVHFADTRKSALEIIRPLLHVHPFETGWPPTEHAEFLLDDSQEAG